MGKGIKQVAGIGVTLAGVASGAGWFTSAFWKSAGLLAVGTIAQGSQKTEGARLTDLGVQLAQEGAELPRGWGTWRQSGTMVWCPGLTEHNQESGGGGKGGPKQNNASYSTSYVVVGGRGPITYLKRWWLNDKLFYDVNASSGLVLTHVPETNHWYGEFNGITVAVYSGTQNQPVDSALQTAKGVGQWTNYPGLWYVRVSNLPLGDYNNQPPNNTFEVYNAQTDLAAIVREICLCVGRSADDLDLYDLEGITVAPNEDEGFLAAAQTSAGAAIEQLGAIHNFRLVDEDGLLRAKLRGGDIVAVLSGRQLRQHADNEETPGEQTIESDRMERPEEVVVTIMDPGRTYNPGSRVASLGSVSDTEPIEVDTHALIPTRARRRESLTLSAAMRGGRATRLARIRLAERHVGRRTYPLAWGMAHAWLGPADEVTVATADGSRRVYLPKISLPWFGANVCTAQETNPLIYTMDTPADGPTIPGAGIITLGDVTCMVWDGNLITDRFLNAAGIYVAVSAPYGHVWNAVSVTGASGQQAYPDPNGSTQAMPRATLGYSVGTMADFAGGSNTWDRTSMVTVDLLYGTLASVTEDALLGGSDNAIRIGDEYIQFATATPVPNPDTDDGLWGGRRRYHLTNLLRGRRGTEFAIADHEANEPAVLLTDAVRRINVELVYLNRDLPLTITESGGAGTRSDDLTAAITGASLKPYSPALLTAVRETGTGDLLLSWKRRSRASDTYYTTGQDVPLSETSELYDVEIIDGSTLKRTWQPTTTMVRYTAAQQTTDFGAPLAAGDTLDLTVYQRSGWVGRGYPTRETITIQPE